MRISFMAVTNSPASPYLENFVSNIDKRIAIIASSIIFALGIAFGIGITLLYNRRKDPTVNSKIEKKNEGPEVEKKEISAKSEKQIEIPILDKKMDNPQPEIKSMYSALEKKTERPEHEEMDSPQPEKKFACPIFEQKTECPEHEEIDESILELQKQYPGKTIYTEQDMINARVEKKTWIIIKGKVYDVTKFLDEHPGGEEVLLDYSGRDASQVFDDVGHSDEAIEQMKRYFIGRYAGK